MLAKKSPHVSKTQKNKLLDIMKQRPHLRNGKFTAEFTYKKAQEEWQQIAEVLNAIPGSNKDWKMWRKTWQDLLSKIKSKSADINKTRRMTGGGPAPDPLDEFEEGMASLLNPNSIVGHEGVQESVVIFEEYGVTSLELLELRVPAHVPLGTRALLSCRWQLGPADVLYSVKWYKDGKEFFRHVPRDVEPRRKFPLPGVDVEKSSPNGANVTLFPAVLETGGRYRCEVSGERPLFPTVSDHSDMVIVALPDRGPTISGSRLRYQIGDRVQVNCTSGRSRPATRLAWYINGEPAPAGMLQPPTHEQHEDGLETTSLALDFKVKSKHFRKGDLKLKCLATIATVYWRSNEESVQGDKTKGYTRSRELTEGSRADRVQSAGRPDSASALYHASHLLLISATVMHILTLST